MPRTGQESSAATTSTADQIGALRDRFGILLEEEDVGYSKPYPNEFDLIPLPPKYRLPDFNKFSGSEGSSSIEHVSRYLAQVGMVSASDELRVRFFSQSLTGFVIRHGRDKAESSHSRGKDKGEAVPRDRPQDDDRRYLTEEEVRSIRFDEELEWLGGQLTLRAAAALVITIGATPGRLVVAAVAAAGRTFIVLVFFIVVVILSKSRFPGEAVAFGRPPSRMEKLWLGSSPASMARRMLAAWASSGFHSGVGSRKGRTAWKDPMRRRRRHGGERDMASPINFNQFLEKEKLKSNGSNFTDWFRHVRIFLNGGNLQYVLDAPLGDPPAETETDEVKNVYATRKTRYSQVQCAILCSLEADLQKRFEHHDPHELINELKTIFETHAVVECYEASKHFFSCMMEEGSSVSEHMLAMTGHAKKLSDLGIVIPNRLGINRVLQSLPPSYKNFVMNYNMQNMNKELPELFAMLKSAEIKIKKEHQVLMVNKTNSFKKHGKSKGKNKKSGKKAATPPVKPKAGPKPNAECYSARRRDRSVIAPSIWRI
ncbi:hypothetical protein QYE76_044255 [Lolium multiflorum]|uniref:Uncharacterized protein n=1 Tax=Lolium multiflorum TaxID=4521 RepID=A0AAD8TKL1_LOLMU|nr:hypothetical protein QYE76_044255 [Lolium multiflorum]